MHKPFRDTTFSIQPDKYLIELEINMQKIISYICSLTHVLNVMISRSKQEAAAGQQQGKQVGSVQAGEAAVLN